MVAVVGVAVVVVVAAALAIFVSIFPQLPKILDKP